MADQLANHAVAVALGVLLDRVTDVAEVVAALHLGDAEHQALLGDVEQTLRVARDRSPIGIVTALSLT